MYRLIQPSWVKKHNSIVFEGMEKTPASTFARIRNGLNRFKSELPEVTILIPAYNEEKDLLKTLSSISEMKSDYPTELLVVNNNSTDCTQQILDACGVRSVFEPRQGISFTRQTGLEHARGKYILNADADSIYPPGWLNAYVKALKDPAVTCVYGRHSFIPSQGSNRPVLGLYEMVAETLFDLRRKNREFLNVLGFNFAFRKADGLKVGGFNITRQRWQDGCMAMMLLQIGKIKLVSGKDARVWTSDRRLMYDGGLGKAFVKRFIKQFALLGEYITGTQKQTSKLNR